MRFENMEKCVRKIPMAIDEDDLDGSALKILEVIRPTWSKENVTFKLLTDGITNKLVACNLKDGKDEDTILVRVYGKMTDLLIDRKAETKNIILLNRVGLAPRLYATFENGLAYEFVPGCTLTSETVTRPDVYKMVARHMAKLHKTELPAGNREPILWKKTQEFFDLIPDAFADETKQKKFSAIGIDKRQIRKEIDFLREKLSKLDSPIVFAHNDLLLGNVIHTKGKDAVVFIDFEYADFNYQAYDIGNHFAEFVGLENVDYTKYPNKQLQFRWLGEYLAEFLNNENVTKKSVEKLYVEVNQFALAAHVFWGVWALIQAEYSNIDFDYIEYASVRFDEYFDRKEEFLSLEFDGL